MFRKPRAQPETPQEAPGSLPLQGHAAGAALRIERRPRSGGMRFLGNMLIVAGLLMLVGIGAWYGYREWDNQRYRDEVAQKFGTGHFEPPVNATPEPTAAAPKPLPVLADRGFGRATGVQATVVDDSAPVHLVIPSVGIDSKIVPISWAMIPKPGGGLKSEWQVADYAVGHHQGSSNPGQDGNVVLSGHVDYKGEVFKNLNRVNKGDEVVVKTEKGQYLYVVTDLVIVKEEGVSEEQKRANAAYMNPTPDRTLTMITCWPYGVDDHRLIVIAHPYQSSLSAQSEFVIR
jgi:LPXTG-site transpeptidase (sortase) family protein